MGASDDVGGTSSCTRVKIPPSTHVAFAECKFGRLVDSLPELGTGLRSAHVLLFCYAADGGSCPLSMLLIRMRGHDGDTFEVSLTHVAAPEASTQRSAVTALAKDLLQSFGLEASVSEVDLGSVDSASNCVPALLASLPFVLGEQATEARSIESWDHQATLVWRKVRDGAIPVPGSGPTAMGEPVSSTVARAVHECLGVIRDRCALSLEVELGVSQSDMQGFLRPLAARVDAVTAILGSNTSLLDDVREELARRALPTDPSQRTRLARSLWKVFHSHPHLSSSVSSLQSRLVADVSQELLKVCVTPLLKTCPLVGWRSELNYE